MRKLAAVRAEMARNAAFSLRRSSGQSSTAPRTAAAAESPSCAQCVSILQSAEYTLAACPIFRGHLNCWSIHAYDTP